MIVHEVADNQPVFGVNHATWRRNVVRSVLAAVADTPVIFVNGPRQCGKSFLCQTLAEYGYHADYLTFDEPTVLEAARRDPSGFIRSFTRPVVLDEIQRIPELFLPLKASVDRDRRPGRFILTGSSNIMTLPRVADSLAGRMEVIRLWPLAESEVEGKGASNFVDRLFEDGFGDFQNLTTPELTDLPERITRGGYPEARSRRDYGRRRAWFGSYLDSVLHRDVRDISNIDGLTQVPRLFAFLAARVGTQLNIADVSRTVDIPQTTLKRYLWLLEMIFQIELAPAWSTNLGKRTVKAPKLFLTDTGMISYFLDLNVPRLRSSIVYGAVVENFIYMELRKLSGWSETQPKVFHFRTVTGQEVDFVLERAGGELVGVEVKAAFTVTSHDFKGLRVLQQLVPARFKRGIVFYSGNQVLTFGENLFAVPIQCLWQATK